MQYVGQTCRKLKTRFGEHYRKIKKHKKIDTFLYQHFKRTGHSFNNVLAQPVEKLSYDENSTERFNTGAFVCCLVHRGSTDDLLLLQIFSGVFGIPGISICHISRCIC